MSGTAGRALIPQPLPKTIIVYRNGDAFFPGKRMVVKRRRGSTFESFLTSLTSDFKAPFGAVRNLYTVREGRNVTDLDALQQGEGYVAAGAERFRKLEYCQITTKKPPQKKKEQIQPIVHSRIVVPARWKRTNHGSCTINVFTNGDISVTPARVLIPKHTLTSWENVLAMVTEKVHLRTGAVHRLCRLDGYPLHGSNKLENNQYYVAVGAEQFRALPYNLWVPYKRIIRQNNMDQGDLTGKGKWQCPVENYTPAPLPVCLLAEAQAQGVAPPLIPMPFAHTGFREDLEHTARGQMKNHTDSAKPGRAKQQRQVSRIPLLLSTGEGSVFNAKNKRWEMAGAEEVQEDRQLKVDLPIDQVEAKAVEEERDMGALARDLGMLQTATAL
ncbi:doublecortin domain-containing protein 2C [Polymixia lowei]